MAKVRRSAFLAGVSGKLGKDVVFRQMKDGTTIICTKPDFSNRQFSQAQLDVQDRTKQAAAYAKVAAKENPIYAEKAKGTRKNAYNIAIADWHKPPVIHAMRYSDGRIYVDVTDNVQVEKVTITILDPAGKSLESGEAQPLSGIWWEYQPVHKGQIRVEAWDLPGNQTVHEFTPPPGDEIIWQQSTRKH